ncbi:hypothetical protein TNCV_4141641 [Trichonephila clavipes]|nr:hypothetical protein TNCV_4141641 [Trichonephila clavipes]
MEIVFFIRATINEYDETSEPNTIESASAKKLESSRKGFSGNKFETYQGNRIVSLTNLISLPALVCCPDCYSQGLELIEDSVSGLCSHMNLKCKNCSFFKGFPTKYKEDEWFLPLKLFNFFGAKNDGERNLCWQKVVCFSWFTFPVQTCFQQLRKKTVLK